MNVKVLAGMRFIARPNGDTASLPKFVMTLYTGGPIRPLDWRREAVVIDLAGMNVPNQKIPINKDHVIDVGHSTSVNVISSELVLEGVLSGWSKTAKDKPATKAREIARLGKNGFPWQASMDARVDQALEQMTAANQEIHRIGRELRAADFALADVRSKAISGLPDGLRPQDRETEIRANPAVQIHIDKISKMKAHQTALMGRVAELRKRAIEVE